MQVKKGLLKEVLGQPGYLVAVKTLHSSVDADRSGILREAALMAQFNNEYVVAFMSCSVLQRFRGLSSTELMQRQQHGTFVWLGSKISYSFRNYSP